LFSKGSSVSDSTLMNVSVSSISGLEVVNHSNAIMSDVIPSIPYNDIEDGHDDVLLSTGVINANGWIISAHVIMMGALTQWRVTDYY